MTAAARPLLTPNGPRIGTRGQVKEYDALRLTSEQSPGLNDPVSLYRSQRPHVIEMFELELVRTWGIRGSPGDQNVRTPMPREEIGQGIWGHEASPGKALR